MKNTSTSTFVVAPKVIVFDFDNCLILDESLGTGSEEKKQEAWFLAFPEIEREKLVERLLELQQQIAGGKGDRKDIVRVLCKVIGTHDDQLETECRQREHLFDTFVQQGVLDVGISAEKKQVLRKLTQHFSMYINSATPVDALNQSLKALGLEGLFVGIYGRPGSKEGNLREIVEHAGIAPNELLFIDDQPKAAEVAQSFGCQFIGMKTNAVAEWHDLDQSFPTVRKFTELLSMTEK